MKKIILILTFSVAFIGCSSEITKTAETNTTAINTAESAETQTNSEANISKENISQPILKGERIEKPLEVKFDASGLPADWLKVDTNKEKPAQFDTSGGVLKLKIPGGTDLFGENQTAPRLLKPISGDFEIETKVKFDPKTGYQGAGILVFNNEKNFLRFERGFGGIDGGESGVRLDKSVDGEYSAVSGTSNNETASGEVDLKLLRKGKTFTAFMRENSDSEWREVGEFASDYPETVQVGIIGISTSGDITAEFAFIRIMPVAS